MKFLLAFPLLFLASCTKGDPWNESCIRSHVTKHDLAKLSYPPSNECEGLELELVRNGDEIRGYLNAYKSNFKEENSIITILSSDRKKTFEVTRLSGGQRLRLSEESLNYLIETLLQESVTVYTSHFKQTYECYQFKNHFATLQKKPTPYLPEKLITFDLY